MQTTASGRRVRLSVPQARFHEARVLHLCLQFQTCGATMAATTTIRLPPKLRARLGSLAKQTGRSAHSLIVEAVERHTDYEEQMRSLVKEALAADAQIQKSAEGFRGQDGHASTSRLTADISAARPQPG